MAPLADDLNLLTVFVKPNDTAVFFRSPPSPLPYELAAFASSPSDAIVVVGVAARDSGKCSLSP